jgi:hypothetical protein
MDFEVWVEQEILDVLVPLLLLIVVGGLFGEIHLRCQRNARRAPGGGMEKMEIISRRRTGLVTIQISPGM